MVLTKESKIFLTYELGGKYLVRKGKYKEAKIKLDPTKMVKYDSLADLAPATIVIKPMKVEIAPKWDKSTRNIELGWYFIQMCLERPNNPFKRKNDAFFRWLKSPRGQFWKNFAKLSVKERVHTNIKFYVEDMVGPDANFSYEVV